MTGVASDDPSGLENGLAAVDSIRLAGVSLETRAETTRNRRRSPRGERRDGASGRPAAPDHRG